MSDFETAPVGTLERLARAEAERDALAADVERLRAALKYSSEYLYGSHLNVIGHGSKAHMEMVSALEDTPATCLTLLRGEVRRQAAGEWEVALPRLKAEWQAEALVEFGYRYGPESEVRAHSQQIASEIRRQAEGGE